ncbi:hypothetical protein [Schumannella sp. 10F1B-5-1]|uniref:hypothetical protein n=1 Tax=Schumannella sp. 10F1B-5-1 TaxID=2590780 RepID=UPI001130B636|nr:hypothetical protein [Schumannella sp. 10F1B-5-1]TPW73168.1 hypothetical protein FJ658_07980 [Schumannella sp. 10F1B-5-1]
MPARLPLLALAVIGGLLLTGCVAGDGAASEGAPAPEQGAERARLELRAQQEAHTALRRYRERADEVGAFGWVAPASLRGLVGAHRFEREQADAERMRAEGWVQVGPTVVTAVEVLSLTAGHGRIGRVVAQACIDGSGARLVRLTDDDPRQRDLSEPSARIVEVDLQRARSSSPLRVVALRETGEEC